MSNRQNQMVPPVKYPLRMSELETINMKWRNTEMLLPVRRLSHYRYAFLHASFLAQRLENFSLANSIAPPSPVHPILEISFLSNLAFFYGIPSFYSQANS